MAVSEVIYKIADIHLYSSTSQSGSLIGYCHLILKKG